MHDDGRKGVDFAILMQLAEYGDIPEWKNCEIRFRNQFRESLKDLKSSVIRCSLLLPAFSIEGQNVSKSQRNTL